MCKCGCNKCEKDYPILKEEWIEPVLSNNIKNLINSKIPLIESLGVLPKKEFIKLIKEARKLYSRGMLDLGEKDKKLMNSKKII